MLNLPLIKWHFQELCKLLEQDPNNHIIAYLYRDLKSMLNSPMFKKIEAAAPAGFDKDVIQDDDI